MESSRQSGAGQRVAGKVALVSGGARGLGGATSTLLAAHGAAVVIGDLDLQAAERLAEQIRADGGTARAVRLDVTSEADWSAVIAGICAAEGRLDIAVNNAGIAHVASVEDETLEGWRQTQSVNLDGVFLGTKHAITAMKAGLAGPSGSIINISSIRGIVSDPNTPAYDASKGGVRSFTKSAALHCAAIGSGIRVNSVHPGYVLTDMVRNGVTQLPEPEQALAQITALHPLGRLGEPEDIAYAVLYLASDEARFVTGSELVVDGGYTAQ